MHLNAQESGADVQDRKLFYEKMRILLHFLRLSGKL